MAAPHVAYLLPSGQEFIILLILGILLFGRRLPEVGFQVGRYVADLRRGLDSFKRELANDESIRQAKAGLRDLDPRRALDAPRKLADPRRLLDDLNDASLSSPIDPGPGPGDRGPDAGSAGTASEASGNATQS
jgi:Sec-independent protein translocase protein TatA